MDKTKTDSIEKKIGYIFQNKALLRQAFVHKSYTNENAEKEDNRVLAFIGDKILSLITVKDFAKRFGSVGDDFHSIKNRGELHDLWKLLAKRETLSDLIEKADISKYHLLGEGAKKQETDQNDNVEAELFEAILGAVAIDSDWNISALERVVASLHDFDFYIER